MSMFYIEIKKTDEGITVLSQAAGDDANVLQIGCEILASLGDAQFANPELGIAIVPTAYSRSVQ